MFVEYDPVMQSALIKAESRFIIITEDGHSSNIKVQKHLIIVLHL